ncbi:PepSY-like domain-containing protein [Spirosoma gilvum]
MKKISFFLLLLSLFGLEACQHQEVQSNASSEFSGVPAVVVQAVKSTYPTASNIQFTEIDKGNIWESDFTIQTIQHQVKVKITGAILESYAVGSTNNTTGVSSATLPAAAKTYIEKTYPTYKIVAVGEGEYNNQKAYKVLLRGEKEEVTLIFDANGTLFLEFKQPVTSSTGASETTKTFPITKAEDLPAAAAQYLRDNELTFAKGVASVDKDNKKTYLVIATKGSTIYELLFDNDGKLIRSSSTTPPTTTELKSINELPPAAITFLTGYTFEKGVMITVNGQKTYVVVVSKEGKRYEITFDADGKVLSNKSTPKVEEKAISTDKDLPAAITDYLTKTYPNWTFMKGVVVLLDGKPTSYTVVIKAGETLYYVFFNGEGKFDAVKKG